MVKNIQNCINEIVTWQQKTYSYVWICNLYRTKYTNSCKHIRMCEFVISIVQKIQIHANEIITLSRIDMYELVECEMILRQIIFKKLSRYPKN